MNKSKKKLNYSSITELHIEETCAVIGKGVFDNGLACMAIGFGGMALGAAFTMVAHKFQCSLEQEEIPGMWNVSLLGSEGRISPATTTPCCLVLTSFTSLIGAIFWGYGLAKAS